MNALTFRRASYADVPAIVTLLADDVMGMSREDAGPVLNSRYVAAFEAIERDPNQVLAVVVDGEEVVGCLERTFIPGLSRLGMTRGQIEAVRIASTRRGFGLGKAML